MDKKENKLSEKQAAIWLDVQGLSVEYYGLKNVRVVDVCTPVNIDPTRVFLTLKGPAAVISIEGALSNLVGKNWDGKNVPKYIIEMKDRFAVISENPEMLPPSLK